MRTPGSGLNVLLVAVGGAIGASARHGCALLAAASGGGEEAWLLLVNLIGAFLLGFVFVTLDPQGPRPVDAERSPGDLDVDPRKDRLGAFVAVGLIGAFTTYSTLAVLLIERLRAGDLPEVGAMLFVSLAGGLVMVATGVKVGRWRRRKGETG